MCHGIWYRFLIINNHRKEKNNFTETNRLGVCRVNNDNLKMLLEILSIMAETSSGKKKVYVHPHKKDDGTKVKTHYRSTPNSSSGKKK